jgi:hypothetical protein
MSKSPPLQRAKQSVSVGRKTGLFSARIVQSFSRAAVSSTSQIFPA